MICLFLSLGAYQLMKYTVLTGRRRVLNNHGFARRKADEEDVCDFQDVMSGEKSRSHKEGRGRGRGERQGIVIVAESVIAERYS